MIITSDSIGTIVQYSIRIYRVCGLAVTVGNLVKFGTAHDRSTPEVGSVKCIGVYGSEGVSRPSLVLGNSEQNIIDIFDILRTIHNFYSLTMSS